MKWEKMIGVVIVALGAASAGSYAYMKEPPSKTSIHAQQPSTQDTVETEGSVGTATAKSIETVETADVNQTQARQRAREALLEAVQQARQNSLRNNNSPNSPLVKINGSAMPDIEMTWEQYRAWTKIAAALAQRDYKSVEQMLPIMQGLFDHAVVEAMLDAYIEDYQALLTIVADSRCDGYDPQFIWRKTMYMSFALVRLNRSSASLERRATEARSLCGYPS